MSFKCQCLCLIGLLFTVQALLELDNINLVVKKIPKFPFSIEKTFDITIGPQEEDGLLTNSISDTLVIQISTPIGTDKQMALIDFGYKDMFDQELNGQFMNVLSWNISAERNLSVALSFTSLAHNKVLDIYHLNVFSTSERRIMLKNLKHAKNIYRSNITLQFPPKIDISVNSVVNSTYQFPVWNTVDAVCRTHENSGVTPTFHKIKNMNVLSNTRGKNEAKLQFLTTKAIHRKNLTCQVGNDKKSVNIQIFHDPTKVTFEPKVKNVVDNGTSILCLAADGFPIPRTTWNLIEGPKNASNFYKISPYGQRLSMSKNAPIGSRWKFRCSAMNKILGIRHVHSTHLAFRITNNRRNNSEKNWNISGYHDNYLIQEIKRTISNQSRTINKLRLSYDKLEKEMSKWKTNESSLKIELTKLKKNMELLKDEVKSQNREIEKLKKTFNKESKPGPTKVASKGNGSPKISGSALSKPIAIFQWKVEQISRLRKKRKIVHSVRLQNLKFVYPIQFSLILKSRSIFMITLYMYALHGKSAPSNVRGVATMEIYNAGNHNLKKSMKLNFDKSHKSLTLTYRFNYYELLGASVFQSDKVLIQCSLEIKSVRRT